MDFLHRTWAEIDLNALRHNFQQFKKISGNCRLMPVVKANAYGHCAEIIAPVLQEEGADAFAVSNLDEAVALRECGITTPILILGYTPPEAVVQLCEYDIIQSIFSYEYAKELSQFAVNSGVKIKIHIKLDTGMGRIGFDCRNYTFSGINEAIAAAKMQGFSFDGIFTHFACADRTEDTEDGFTDEQFARFDKAISLFVENGLSPREVHCCNSAAFCFDSEKHQDICRLGIILYGLTPDEGLNLPCNLVPVMTLKSTVSMVKEISAGDTINYGRTFKADKTMRVATISAGYADGYPRLLSNCGEVIMAGKRAPVIGRICMDQFSVDVSDIPSVNIGDEVILFGKELPVEELANLCSTINYEIVCGISARVPRIIK